MKDNNWSITLEKFSAGYSALAFTDSLTEFGGGGHSSVMQNVDILDGKLTQGAGLSNLTGTLTEAVQFIMDKAVSNNSTYAIGTASLYNLTSTAISNIHTISGCVEGESIQLLKGNLLYFYNTASAGAIGLYDFSTFNDTWTTGLQKAPHPSEVIEDICLFGNGRYVGVYLANESSMITDKLDFGNDKEVADILYDGGLHYIAVNSSTTGTNRNEGRIFQYDGAALVSTLTDETGVGFQKIGFLYRINGIIYVAYTDISSAGFIIGYINGKAISPLVRFTGTLPTFNKKTLFKNTILFLSDNLAYCAGAIIPQLPFALSQIATSTYSTATAIAAPFGTPLLASNNGVTYVISKFSGYATACTWKSIIFPVSKGRILGYADSIVVLTNTLGASASCNLTLEYNQNSSLSSVQTITTTGKRKHTFSSLGITSFEDFRIALDFSGGSISNNVIIRSITISGHFVEN